MHPVDFLYTQATSIVRPDMEPPALISSGCCYNCGREPEAWLEPGLGYRGMSAYRLPYLHCISCESLYIGSVSILGVERLSKGVPVGNRFGMLSSAALLVENDSATLLASAKILNKLPGNFPLNTRELTGQQVTRFFIDHEPVWPALYISDLGRKKAELINNLRLSYNKDLLFLCSAEQCAPLNANVFQALSEPMATWAADRKLVFIRAMRNLALGNLPPLALVDYFNEHPQERALALLMPRDPHHRLHLLKLL